MKRYMAVILVVTLLIGAVFGGVALTKDAKADGAQATRSLPDTVSPGATFDVVVTFVAPASQFNSIGLTETAPSGWDASGNLSLTSPGAAFMQDSGNKLEYVWFGPYQANQSFTVTYHATVPQNASGNYTFSGSLVYYIAGTGPFVESVAGDSVVTVQ